MTQRRVNLVGAHRISKLYAATNKVRKETGKRSGLEVQIASHLVASGVEFDEEKNIEAVIYRSRREKKYHPDFRLKNGIIIEAKGWFKGEDREKHLCIKYQRPELDIRFVFTNPKAKLGKGSQTTYGEWCVKYGFRFAKGTVPQEWIDEPTKEKE
jgi:Phage endonuclease I